MTVEYSKEGIAVFDFEAMNFAQIAWIKQRDISVANEIVFLAFRVMVKNGVILQSDELYFLFEGKKIWVDRNGELSEHPLGFCETAAGFLYQLI